MKIEEGGKLFLFKFPYEMTELSIPVYAPSREEAGIKLRKVLSDMQMDLAMEFPAVSEPTGAAMPPTTPTVVPTLLLDLRIEELLRRLGAKFVMDEDKIKIIKQWTKLDFMPENYEAITKALEELLNQNGKEEGKS